MDLDKPEGKPQAQVGQKRRDHETRKESRMQPWRDLLGNDKVGGNRKDFVTVGDSTGGGEGEEKDEETGHIAA
ncbi:hypothetical protein OQA88_8951 [Cercophora sp. LCS_1]